MKKTLEIEIEVPDTPNFLRYGDRKVLPIAQFSDDELREIGKQWTENLIAKATKNRVVIKTSR